MQKKSSTLLIDFRRLILTWSTRGSRRWLQFQAAPSSLVKRVLEWFEVDMLDSLSWAPCRWKFIFDTFWDNFALCICILYKWRYLVAVIWPTGWSLGRWWKEWGVRWIWWLLPTPRFAAFERFFFYFKGADFHFFLSRLLWQWNTQQKEGDTSCWSTAPFLWLEKGETHFWCHLCLPLPLLISGVWTWLSLSWGSLSFRMVRWSSQK